MTPGKSGTRASRSAAVMAVLWPSGISINRAKADDVTTSAVSIALRSVPAVEMSPNSAAVPLNVDALVAKTVPEVSPAKAIKSLTATSPTSLKIIRAVEPTSPSTDSVDGAFAALNTSWASERVPVRRVGASAFTSTVVLRSSALSCAAAASVPVTISEYALPVPSRSTKSLAAPLRSPVTTPAPALIAFSALAVDTVKAVLASNAMLVPLMVTLLLALLSTSACNSTVDPVKDVNSSALTEPTWATTRFTSAGLTSPAMPVY